MVDATAVDFGEQALRRLGESDGVRMGFVDDETDACIFRIARARVRCRRVG